MGIPKLIAPILLILGLSMVLFPLLEVNAADKTLNNSIGITISQQCKIMIMNNFPTNCPDIKTLVDLNLDTSNRKISGDFGYLDGLYQRLPGLHKNTYGIYIFDQTYRIFIDPPGDIAYRVKMITIENNLDTYIMQTQMKKINDQRTINKYRFVNSGCTEAVIGGNTWKETLPDTIHFLRNNCSKGSTNFKTEFTIDDPISIQDITSSQKYKEDKWKSSAKKTHKNYQIGNDTTINRSVTEDKDPRYVPPKTTPFNYTKYR